MNRLLYLHSLLLTYQNFSLLNRNFKKQHMKKIGIIILGIIILVFIVVLTVVMEVLEFFVGGILFLVAIFFLGYLYSKVKDKLD